MSSRRRGRRVPPKAHTTAAGDGAAETSQAADRPIGTRSANRAAKRATAGVRAKPMVRDGRGRGGKKGNSNTAVIALIVGALAIGVAVIAFGNPFGTPGASPSPAASISDQVGDGTCPTTQPDKLPAGEIRTVTINTPQGDIIVQVEADLAPIATANFIALVDCHFYDGSVFHRTAALQDGTPFVIQGGQAKPGTSDIGYAIQDDPVTATYKRGTVAMARTSDPNSQTSQFFIVLDDSGGPILVSNGNNYAILGTVISGMGTADKIFQASGGAELPTNPIPMTSVTVSAAPAATASPGASAAAPSAAAPSTEPSTAGSPAATSTTVP